MKAHVFKHNPKNDYIALEYVDAPNTFTIIQLLSGSLMLGDLVEWKERHELGSGRLLNCQTQNWMDVIFENHDVHKDQLLKQLRIDD